MKILKLLPFLFILTLIISCTLAENHEPPTPKKPEKGKVDTTKISLNGRFVLYDGLMYIDNHDTGEKNIYHHFDNKKKVSSLRPGGSYFEFETIYKDSTTFAFYPRRKTTNYSKLVVNGDLTKHYVIYSLSSFNTIMADPNEEHPQPELFGGSARPITDIILVNFKQKTIRFQIQQMEVSINGNNCSIWNELYFKMVEQFPKNMQAPNWEDSKS